jgi:hypothetical protein
MKNTESTDNFETERYHEALLDFRLDLILGLILAVEK